MDKAVGIIVELIFQPGSSLKLVPVINVSILCLLVVLCFVTYTKIATIHLVVLSSLAVGLLLSVNWFVSEFKKAVKEQEEGGRTAVFSQSSEKGQRADKTD